METPDRVFYRHIRGLFDDDYKGKFIECGANDGVAGSVCYYFEHNDGWNGINIEPNPYCKEELSKNRPECRNLFCGLAEKEGVYDFYIPSRYATRSQFAGGATIFKGIHDGKQLEKKEVYCMTYKKVIEIYELQKLDLFVLDVEGSELAVIESMRKTHCIPDVLVVEYSKVDKRMLAQHTTGLGYRFVSEYKDNYIYDRRRKKDE